jgi:hypothetical protein
MTRNRYSSGQVMKSLARDGDSEPIVAVTGDATASELDMTRPYDSGPTESV